MGCCGRKMKEVIETGQQIKEGYKKLLTGEKYEFTDGRIDVCRECEKCYWIRKQIFCSICKCFIPAKARAKNAECPLDKWPDRKGVMKNG